MIQTMNAGTATATPDRRLIAGLVAVEYRSMVLRQLQVTVEWQQTEWLDYAACRRTGQATRSTCTACPVRAQCLTAALAIDDPAEWRGSCGPDSTRQSAHHGGHIRLAVTGEVSRLEPGRGGFETPP
jgi:hypothetical protein